MTLAGVTRQAAAAMESWQASCRRLDIELIWLLDSIAWRAASHGSSLLDDPPTSHPRDDAESESANRSVKVWMHVLGDLKRPGVRDILNCCVDGLTGFPEAIEAVFPRPTAQSAAGATAPLKRPWPRRNGPPRGSSASSSSPLRTASAVRRRPRAKRRQDRRGLADQGQAREDLVPAKSTAAPDSLPSFRPLKAVSGAQLVRVRSSLRFEFRDVRARAVAVDKALANAIKKPAAQRDGASAKDLKAGPAQAQLGVER